MESKNSFATLDEIFSQNFGDDTIEKLQKIFFNFHRFHFENCKKEKIDGLEIWRYQNSTEIKFDDAPEIILQFKNNCQFFENKNGWHKQDENEIEFHISKNDKSESFSLRKLINGNFAEIQKDFGEKYDQKYFLEKLKFAFEKMQKLAQKNFLEMIPENPENFDPEKEIVVFEERILSEIEKNKKNILQKIIFRFFKNKKEKKSAEIIAAEKQILDFCEQLKFYEDFENNKKLKILFPDFIAQFNKYYEHGLSYYFYFHKLKNVSMTDRRFYNEYDLDFYSDEDNPIKFFVNKNDETNEIEISVKFEMVGSNLHYVSLNLFDPEFDEKIQQKIEKDKSKTKSAAEKKQIQKKFAQFEQKQIWKIFNSMMKKVQLKIKYSKLIDACCELQNFEKFQEWRDANFLSNDLVEIVDIFSEIKF